jgi:hypothetical protein
MAFSITAHCIILCAIMLSVAIFNCHAECRYAECRYAECSYAECRYDECRGAVFRPYPQILASAENALSALAY